MTVMMLIDVSANVVMWFSFFNVGEGFGRGVGYSSGLAVSQSSMSISGVMCWASSVHVIVAVRSDDLMRRGSSIPSRMISASASVLELPLVK